MAATTKTWVNGSAPSCEDDDLNGFKAENNNLILGSGQALSTADHEQTHKAVAVYAAGGEYYTDSGAVNAYVLNVIGAKVAPPALFVGMRIAFTAGNTNTGTSTVNPAGLGVTGLKMPDGSNTPAGVIKSGRLVVARYDGANFRISIETLYPVTPGTSQALSVLVADGNNKLGSLTQLGINVPYRAWGVVEPGGAGFDSAIDLGGGGALAHFGTTGGTYMVANAYFDGTNWRYVEDGFASYSSVDKSTGRWVAATAPSGLAGGVVTFTNRLFVANDGTTTVNGNTVWHAGNLAAGTRGAIASNGGFSVPNAVETTIAFTAEAYDTDAIHNNITNNSRLTVPAGISKIKVTACVAFAANVTGDRYIVMNQNGVYSPVILPAVSAKASAVGGASTILNMVSGVMSVAPGDYLEVRAYQNSGGALNAVCWFAMELIS